MSVPTHGAGCETKSFWMGTCQYCHGTVYFFACTCGSKVFFNTRGPPWLRHDDRCWQYLLSILRGKGQSVAEIREELEAKARLLGRQVPAGVVARLDREEMRESTRTTIVDVLPQDQAQRIRGRVVAIDRQVNFLKRFKFPDAPMSKGLLGKLGREPYVQLVVREDRDPETGTCVQMTCFMRKAEFSELSPLQGAQVTLFAVPHRVHKTLDVWLVDHVDS